MCIYRQYIHNHGHAIPCQAIWKEFFWRSDFSPQISSKPPSLQEVKHRKKREKKYWKEKKRKEKEEEREKLQESLQIKGEVNILRGEKHFNFKNLLLTWFSPPSSYHFKNPFQNHW
jgi:hypothetical protein